MAQSPWLCSRRSCFHRVGSCEHLEVRTLLTTAPVLAPLPDLTLLAGSPLHIPLNASDAEGQPLSYSASSSSASVSTLIPEGNRSLRINVDGFGSMVFELFENRVPRVTSQLIDLAAAGYYSGSGFHYVANGERIQGGRPGGDPFDNSPSPLGPVDDQFHVDLQHNRTGLLSLARDGFDDTGDAEFLITEGAQRDFDVQHSVAGLLVEGESVREAISNVSTNATDRPDTPVVINSVDVFVDDQNGVLMLQAQEGYSGSAMITVTVTDSDGNEDQQSFTVTVLPDAVNTPPWLADIPQVQTLTGTPVSLELAAVDVEGNASSYFDESRLDMFGLAVPQRANAELNYSVDPLTGVMRITATNGLSGTQLLTVATAIQTTAVDYQVMPVKVLAAAAPLSITAADRIERNDADHGSADTFRLVRNGDQFNVLINGVLSYIATLDSVTTLTIGGSSNDSTLIIDLSSGNPIPAGGLVFNGDPAALDTLLLRENGQARFVLGASPGLFSIDGHSVTLSSVETVVENPADLEWVFTFSAEGDVIVFSDDDTPGDGVSRLSNATTGFVFDFETPISLGILSGDGADSVLIDVADGDAPRATLIGGSGDDTLTGGAADDQLDGEAGNDVLSGGAGNDFLIGKADSDTLFGGDGDDSLLGSAGKDDLSGGPGNDQLFGQGSTGDTLRGGDGDDTLDGGPGNDILIEAVAGHVTATTTTLDGRGNDALLYIERLDLTGSSGPDQIDASQFDVPGFTEVTLTGAGGSDSLVGSNGSDQLNGNSGDDTLVSGSGDDRLYGGSGRDSLFGGEGDDKVLGNGGSGDWLSGGPGDDLIKGGAGTDRLVEAADVSFVLTNKRLIGLGTDVLAQLEAASLAGGPSDNVIDASAFTNGFVLLFGLDGNDSLVGGVGHDRIEGGKGDDTLKGGDGSDTLKGGEGRDGLSGGLSSDSLQGEAGDDTLFGGELADILSGGSGRDLIVGGPGADLLSGDDDTDTLVGGRGDGQREAGDVLDDLSEAIDNYFLTTPLPDWGGRL
jgi:Ca2+-binding RTX toxin-like protein